MNKERINEVGDLLEIDTSDIKESKFKVFIKRFTFPLVQIAFFIVSTLSGTLLGYWEKQIQLGYPFTPITRIYRAGIPTLLIIHSGNTLFSIKTRKKFGFSNFQTISMIIINLILSAISFFVLYKVVTTNPALGGTVRYGSYNRKYSEIMGTKVPLIVEEVQIKNVVEYE